MKTKIASVILITLLTATVSAATCASFKSLKETKKMCWLESEKAWISESCVAKNAKCDALTYLKDKNIKFEKDIYRDGRNNETIFAIFKDKSMLELVE